MMNFHLKTYIQQKQNKKIYVYANLYENNIILETGRVVFYKNLLNKNIQVKT